METLLSLRVFARKVIYFFSLRNFDTNRLSLLWKAVWYPANEIDDCIKSNVFFFICSDKCNIASRHRNGLKNKMSS